MDRSRLRKHPRAQHGDGLTRKAQFEVAVTRRSPRYGVVFPWSERRDRARKRDHDLEGRHSTKFIGRTLHLRFRQEVWDNLEPITPPAHPITTRSRHIFEVASIQKSDVHSGVRRLSPEAPHSARRPLVAHGEQQLNSRVRDHALQRVFRKSKRSWAKYIQEHHHIITRLG